MNTSNIWIATAAYLLITVGIGLADDTPDISSFSNGQITWTNVNPNLYYTVEWKPTLTGTNSWTGSFRNLQDLQSSASIVTSTVPAFFRIVGSSNMAHTAELSSTTTVVNAGYYETTDLEQVETNLASGNIHAGVSIFGVSGKTEVVDTTSGDATSENLLSGKKAWIDGYQVIGAMNNIGTQNVTPGTADVTIPQGYHSGSGRVTGDADLVAGNIRAGVNIFGISGNPNVVNTSSGTAHYPTIKFGKIAWVDGIELTGTLAGGASCDPGATYSPLKRWCDNGNGTITDTTTGLIWYHKGDVFRGAYDINSAAYTPPCSPAQIANMHHSSPADLTDGSETFDWRLPTVNEMLKFTSGLEAISPSTQYLFTGIVTGWYWTCTMYQNPTPMKFMKVQMPEVFGYAIDDHPATVNYAMAVRCPL